MGSEPFVRGDAVRSLALLVSPSPVPSPHAEEVVSAHRQMVAVYQPGRGLSPVPHHAGLQPPDLWEDKFLLLQPPQSVIFCYGSLS